MVICELCDKEFKTTQGLRGHKTFVHGITGSNTKLPTTPVTTEHRLSELEQLLGITRQHTEQATEQLPSRLRERLGLTDSNTQPITEQLVELNELVGNLSEQVAEQAKQFKNLAEELELARVTKSMLEANEAEVAKVVALADKVDEWKDSHNKLARVVNDNVEVVKRLPEVIEGQTDRLYQILLTYIEVGTLSPEALELLRERAKAADSRRGELPMVGIVKGKVTAPGYRYLPNIDMSVRKES